MFHRVLDALLDSTCYTPGKCILSLLPPKWSECEKISGIYEFIDFFHSVKVSSGFASPKAKPYLGHHQTYTMEVFHKNSDRQKAPS